MAHKSQKLQFEIVAVLGLLSLFTHNHLFWVIGLLLAMVDLPDFGTPLRRIAGSVEKMAGVPPEPRPGRAADRADAHGAADGPVRTAAPPRARCRVMLEIMLCSLVTILAGLSLSPLSAGQAYRPRDHVVFRVVRAAVWHHDLPDAHGRADHDDLLLSSVDQRRRRCTSGPFRSCPEATGRVAEVHIEFSAPVKQGEVLFRLDSSKQQAALTDGQAQDRRSRCRHACGAGRYHEGGRPA